MGRLHDALKASGYTGHPLEVLLVRLLFCLFADDTGIFQPAQAFRAFIEERTAADGSDLGARLAQLFRCSTRPRRNAAPRWTSSSPPSPTSTASCLKSRCPWPTSTPAMREALLDACALDWSAISPAIFGSLFQSIMDAKARRNLGAHYTSKKTSSSSSSRCFWMSCAPSSRRSRATATSCSTSTRSCARLTFFDPACGCGNFLVISYRELRCWSWTCCAPATNSAARPASRVLDVHQLIGLNVDQFYGIEIEEFPAQIAQVALWLVDHQMNLRVSEEFGLYFARIPLAPRPHIVHGNALTLDWNEVLPAERCSFVLGNPPFVGAKFMTTRNARTRAPCLPASTTRGCWILWRPGT
jgi:hypothetical protein